MHNFGNIGNNLERLAYQHILEYSIQIYGHFSGCVKSIAWAIFRIFGRNRLRINTSLKIENIFLKEYNSAIHGKDTIPILRQLLSTPPVDGRQLQ